MFSRIDLTALFILWSIQNIYAFTEPLTFDKDTLYIESFAKKPSDYIATGDYYNSIVVDSVRIVPDIKFEKFEPKPIFVIKIFDSTLYCEDGILCYQNTFQGEKISYKSDTMTAYISKPFQIRLLETVECVVCVVSGSDECVFRVPTPRNQILYFGKLEIFVNFMDQTHPFNNENKYIPYEKTKLIITMVGTAKSCGNDFKNPLDPVHIQRPKFKIHTTERLKFNYRSDGKYFVEPKKHKMINSFP